MHPLSSLVSSLLVCPTRCRARARAGAGLGLAEEEEEGEEGAVEVGEVEKPSGHHEL